MIADAATTPPTIPARTLTPSSPLPVTASPLPTLSPENKLLLRAFLKLNFDFDALAEQTGRDIIDLLQWSTQPDPAAYIAFARAEKRLRREQDYLDKLEKVFDQSDTPIEKRRAVTALLRALTRSFPSAGSSGYHHAPRGASSPPSPYATPRKKTIPPPLFLPTPDQSPEQIITSLSKVFRQNRDDVNLKGTVKTLLSTLHAHCAPNAKIFQDALAPDPSDFVHNPPDSLANILRLGFNWHSTKTIESSDTRAVWTLYCNAKDCENFALAITLQRASAADPFLITAFVDCDTS